MRLEEANMMLPPLDDPSRYTVIPNVAVLDEGEQFSAEFLSSVVSETNNRTADGDYVLLTLGHTTDNPDETTQPEPVGYVKGVKLGRINDRKAILADLYVQTERYDEVMTYPRRSAEVWHDEDYTQGFLDIVSFLRRTPARQLGLVTLRLQNCGAKSIYINPEVGDLMTETQTQADFEKLVASLQGTLTQFAKAKLEKECDKEEDDEDDKKKDENAKDCADADTKDDMAEEEDDDKEKDDNAADYAAPSGTNSFVPGTVSEKKAKKMRQDSDRIRITRLEREKDELRKQLDLVLLQLRREQIEKDLTQLEAEGHQFDRVEELTYCETLSKDSYDKHLSRIRTRYRRSPIGAGMVRLATDPTANGGTMSKDDISKVVKLAMDGRTDFESALNTYKQKKEAN